MLARRANQHRHRSLLHKQRGTSLVELMVAMAMGLIAISAVISVYSSTAQHTMQYLKQAHVRQQLHSLLHVLVRDLKRTGFHAFNPLLRSPAANPFQNNGNQLQSGAYKNEAEHSCALFSYDLDQDGRLGIGSCPNKICPENHDSDNVEQFGFRLQNGRAQSRYAGNRLDCSSGYWQSITDNDIAITTLKFSIHTTCMNLEKPDQPCNSQQLMLIAQAVEIDLSGQLKNQDDTRINLHQWIQLRNQKIQSGTIQ